MYDMPIILTLRPCKDVVESLGNSRSRGLGGAARLDTDACLIARLRHLAGRALGHGTLGNLWACIFNCGEPRRQQLSQSRATVGLGQIWGAPEVRVHRQIRARRRLGAHPMYPLYVPEYSGTISRLSALPGPRVLVEMPCRTFVSVHRNQMMARLRELMGEHCEVI